MSRLLPGLNPENRPFWTGGANAALQIACCNDCGTFIHPPRPVCHCCLSDDVAPRTVAGTGVIDTYTVNCHPWFPGQEVPYVIARVSLDGAGGVFLTTNIVGCEPESVDVGDPVQVVFEQHGEVFLPLFEPVRSGDSSIQDDTGRYLK